MTGRHRRPRRFSYEGRRLIGGATLAAFFAVATVYTLNVAIAQVKECDSVTTLSVAVAPDIAPAIREFEINDQLEASCISVSLQSVESKDIGAIDAHVWIPETALWTEAVDNAERWDIYRDSLAANPIGVYQGEGDSISSPREARVADPRADATGLLWLVTFGVDDDVATAAKDPTAPPVVSQTALHAAGGGDLHDLNGMETPVLPYPLLINTGLDSAKRQAVERLSLLLASDGFDRVLQSHGFGAALKSPTIYSIGVASEVLNAWGTYSE